jgi:hypothetical protein
MKNALPALAGLAFHFCCSLTSGEIPKFSRHPKGVLKNDADPVGTDELVCIPTDPCNHIENFPLSPCGGWLAVCR